MCSACPAIDLNTRDVRCRQAECLITDQAVVVPSTTPESGALSVDSSIRVDQKSGDGGGADDDDNDDDDDNYYCYCYYYDESKKKEAEKIKNRRLQKLHNIAIS